MVYIFKTTTTMKQYNGEKWWIDRDYIRETRIAADNMTEALEQFREYADSCGVDISRSAIKGRRRMYRDGAGQIGYVITGKVDMGPCEQYVDLWVEILSVAYPFRKSA